MNLKGGVGKTTLCVNLAYGLAYYKRLRVLIVDLDPQANATQYLLSDQSYRSVYLSTPPKKLSVAELYEDLLSFRRRGSDQDQKPNAKDYVQRVFASGPSCLDLLASKLELSLITAEGGTVHYNGQIRWLLEQVGSEYDLVFIDCPPTISRMLWAAFEASQYVLIPIKPDFLSTIGLPLLARVMDKMYTQDVARRAEGCYLPATLRTLGLVFTMYNPTLTMTRESEREVKRVARTLGYRVFDTRISNSTKFTWSAKKTLPIFRTEPRSKYAVEIEELVEEFCAQLDHAKEQA